MNVRLNQPVGPDKCLLKPPKALEPKHETRDLSRNLRLKKGYYIRYDSWASQMDNVYLSHALRLVIQYHT